MIALVVIILLLQILTLCLVVVAIDAKKADTVIAEHKDETPALRIEPARADVKQEKREAKPKYRTWSQIAAAAEAKSADL